MTPQSDATHRRTISIGQDLVYSCSRGRLKTPKHVALPLAMKQLTGSSQIVTILNRFGLGISESQLTECETAMAKLQIDEQRDKRVFIPSNIKPRSFITLCWDSNDFCEETLSSGGTTHCCNEIIVQRVVHDQESSEEREKPVRVPNRHFRTVALPNFQELECNAGKRTEPSNLQLSDDTGKF